MMYILYQSNATSSHTQETRLLDVQSIPPKSQVPKFRTYPVEHFVSTRYDLDGTSTSQRKSLVCLLWLHKQFYPPRPPPPSPAMHAKEFNVQVYPISVGEVGGQWKCASSRLRRNLLRVTVCKARKSIIIYEKLDENQYIKNDTLIPRSIFLSYCCSEWRKSSGGRRCAWEGWSGHKVSNKALCGCGGTQLYN